VFATQGDAPTTIDLTPYGTAPFKALDSSGTITVALTVAVATHDQPSNESLKVQDAHGEVFQVTGATQPSPGAAYGLSVSPDGRHLRDADGKSWYINGDSPWSLMVQLGRADATTYLSDRHAKGVNVVLANLVEHEFSDQSPPWKNANGDVPFTATLSSGSLDFTKPNEAYWQHVDWIVREAYRYGITVLAFPAYVGYGHGSEGWANEIGDNGTQRMATYGTFVGTRYRDYPNIIWSMGGDAPPSVSGDDLTPEINALANAIKAADPNHLMTAHSQRNRSSVDDYSEPWLDINATYSDSGNVPAEIHHSYSQAVMPTFLIESKYGGEGPDDHGLRVEMYQATLGGGVGHMYGNSPTWYFGGGWQSDLDSLGAQYLPYVARLTAARDLAAMSPDWDHAVVTGGWGSALDQDFVPVLHGSRMLVAYCPSGCTLQIDGSKLTAGTYDVRWYNVRTGATRDDGTQTVGVGGFSLGSPDGNDWVLLLDDSTLGLPAP